MIVMSFLLNAYWAKSRRSQPAGCGLPCPPELEKLLATSSRCVVPSVTDGNCALHAFAISLVDEASRNKALSATNAYKQLLPFWRAGVDDANTYLRKRCVDSMNKINDSIVWEGMRFNTLAMAMSSNQDTTFGAYVDRLARNGEWLDASALHDLACSFKADLMVWQPAVEPALLGHSCVAGASPSTVMLHVALVIDLHFGGIRLLADQQNFNTLLDEGEFIGGRRLLIRERAQSLIVTMIWRHQMNFHASALMPRSTWSWDCARRWELGTRGSLRRNAWLITCEPLRLRRRRLLITTPPALASYGSR